jgi:hypothetical protein
MRYKREVSSSPRWRHPRRLPRPWLTIILFALALTSAASRMSAQLTLRSPVNPLLGSWTLNRGRTHYGVGVDQRVRETFVCEPSADAVTCTIRSVRSGGRQVVGRFTAALDGKARPVVGIPDVDQVVLEPVAGGAADATFHYRGTPVFAYRAFGADDGRSLSIVSVDPVSHAVLTTVVVYDRR